jgi:hypothetical protein
MSTPTAPVPYSAPMCGNTFVITQMWAAWFRQFVDQVSAIAVAAAGNIGTPWEGVPTNIDNTNFTVPFTPLASFTFRVFRNGLREQLTEHYSRTGANFALTTPLDPTQEDIYVEFHY